MFVSDDIWGYRLVLYFCPGPPCQTGDTVTLKSGSGSGTWLRLACSDGQGQARPALAQPGLLASQCCITSWLGASSELGLASRPTVNKLAPSRSPAWAQSPATIMQQSEATVGAGEQKRAQSGTLGYQLSAELTTKLLTIKWFVLYGAWLLSKARKSKVIQHILFTLSTLLSNSRIKERSKFKSHTLQMNCIIRHFIIS